MKYPELKINIPEPCHEDWSEMTPTQKGRFCGVCTKEVIDFTSESDETIVKHFQKHDNVCGRFYTFQLDRKLIVDRKKRNRWVSYAASLLVPITLFSQEVKNNTKHTPQIVQTNSNNYKSLNIGSLHKQREVKKDSLTVNGTITDDTGLPLPGASIHIKGTKIKTSTDFDGNYKINIKKNDFLVISFIGYKSAKIQARNNVHNAQLKIDKTIKQDVIVAGYATVVREKYIGAVTTIKFRN